MLTIKNRNIKELKMIRNSSNSLFNKYFKHHNLSFITLSSLLYINPLLNSTFFINIYYHEKSSYLNMSKNK